MHLKTKTQHNLQYDYCCSQEQDRAEKSVSQGIRDAPRMDRFPCQSNLRLRPCLESRTLGLRLYHLPHQPYSNIRLSDEVLQFVQARILDSTPAEVYRDLLAANVSGSKLATQHQVYYQWQQASSKIWRKDSDQFKSAVKLLTDKQHTFKEYISGNVRGLTIYIEETISRLAPTTKEVAIDSTFGTNNAGMELFAVLAEYDGAGFPLAYCFCQTMALEPGPGRSQPGAQTQILCQFLQHLRGLGLQPAFFGTDKDQSEISAIKHVWPEVTVQLCYWHVRRAIRAKLRDGSKCRILPLYDPCQAQFLVPELEMCWGSSPVRRSNGEHRYGSCQCPSRMQTLPEAGRSEPSNIAERDSVLAIVSRHFNSHSLIPDKNGTHRTADVIHSESATEMYRWCKSREYPYLWAYLFTHWYRPGQWELWARSANPNEIPALKTTMIVEAHWRKIKHDYLHRFNRPRIDLVIWILLSRIIPDCINRMDALIEGNHRKVSASWRKAFKKQWKDAATKEVPIDNIKKYHTDPFRWTCACDAFLESRFLICKHIISCHQSIQNPLTFFQNIRRRTTSPFWQHKQLVLLPQFTSFLESISTDAQSSGDICQENLSAATDAEDHTDDDTENPADQDADSVTDRNKDAEDIADTDEGTEAEFESFKAVLQSLMVINTDQLRKHNTGFVKKFMKTYSSMRTLDEEITKLQNKRTMPSTWKPHKHPLTMYYR